MGLFFLLFVVRSRLVINVDGLAYKVGKFLWVYLNNEDVGDEYDEKYLLKV